MHHQLDDLMQRVQRLEADLALLQTALAASIRTSRLAILDDDGVERIVLGIGVRGTASVFVRSTDHLGDSTGIEIHADTLDPANPHAGISLMQRGNTTSHWGLG